VVQADEVDRGLHDPVEPATRLVEDRAQVREDLFCLFLDRTRLDLRVTWPECQLPRDEHQVAGLDRLRVRSSLKRSWCSVRPDDDFLCHAATPFARAGGTLERASRRAS